MDFKQNFLESLPAGVDAESLLARAPGNMWDKDPKEAACFALAKSGVFDSTDYYKRYPDVEQAAIDPIFHFVNYGLFEGRYFNALSFPSDSTRKNNPPAARPLVSVIVPVFNNARYLRECFGSILEQSLKNIEVIIVNDGSTDPEAVAIMDEFAARDNRIKLIHKKNTGYGHSMNTGLDAASGKYFGIVESDDFIDSQMFENLVKIADENQLDFVKSDYRIFYGNEKNRIFEDKIIYNDNNAYNQILNPVNDYNYFHIYNVIWNGIYNKEFLLRNNIRFNETPGASYQDNGFWFQTMMHASRFMIIKDQFYNLRRDNSESSIFSKDKSLCMINEYKFIYEKLKKLPQLYEKYKKIFRYKCYNNYMFTLLRVDKNYRRQLIKLYQAEFSQALKDGEIDPKYFNKDYCTVQAIINGEYQPSWLDSPKVSVIMAVYNAEKYLKQSIDSILNQTFLDLELICMDDGSTDNSFAIMREFTKKSKRIKIFSQQNSGPGNARNACFKHASGDYVIFLDADDLFDSHLVEKLYVKALQTNSDICVCGSASFDYEVKDAKKIEYSLRLSQLPLSQSFTIDEVSGNIFKAFVGWAWDKIYRKEFLEENNLAFPGLFSSEDMQFVFSSLLKARKISIIDEQLVFHRVNIPNSVSNSREKNPLDFVQSLSGLKKFMKENNIFDKYFKSFASYAIHAFLWNFNSLKGNAALQLYNYKQNFYKNMELGGMPADDYLDQREYAAFKNLLES